MFPVLIRACSVYNILSNSSGDTIMKRRALEMSSALHVIVVLFAVACHVTQASEDEKLTIILDRLEKLETENRKKDSIISGILEKTKYCPS